jgi:hypothetical protein
MLARRPCGVPQHLRRGSGQAPAIARAARRCAAWLAQQYRPPPQCGLTLPSRGRPQAGFAHLRPPLMSNVRRQQKVVAMRDAWLLCRPRNRPVATAGKGRQAPCSSGTAARRGERLSSLGVLCCPAAVTRRAAVAIGPAAGAAPHRIVKARRLALPNDRSPALPRQYGAAKRDRTYPTALLSNAAAASYCIFRRWATVPRLSPCPSPPMPPNPSIEGTSTMQLRCIAAAPHVKR